MSGETGIEMKRKRLYKIFLNIEEGSFLLHIAFSYKKALTWIEKNPSYQNLNIRKEWL